MSGEIRTGIWVGKRSENTDGSRRERPAELYQFLPQNPGIYNLREKWLLLTGDEHVNSLQTYNSTGIVELVRPTVNVVGFRYQTISAALTDRTLQQITDLENIAST